MFDDTWTSTRRGGLCAIALIAAISGSNAVTAAELTAAWVQYSVDGPQVRAVVDGECPPVAFDGIEVPLMRRAAPTDQHADTVCVANVPKGTTEVLLQETTLPAPPLGEVKRVAIVGDTGCRVSDKHGLYQACNNNSEWPLSQIATSIEDFRPDLIIYLGDYIYRESPCPDGNNGCKGTPFGDTHETWMVDWLLPTAPMHRAAPMVLIRGNHETCSRAGMGWFRYLDARDYSNECKTDSDSWIAEVDPLRIAVLDTSYLDDTQGQPLVDFFADEFRDLGNSFTENKGWIATHRPIWGVGADDDTGEAYEPTTVLQEAVRSVPLGSFVELLLGSHLHLAEAIDFVGDRPPQLVVGNGGTQLVPSVDLPDKIDGVEIDMINVFYQFGFVTMELAPTKNWDIAFRDVLGREIETCNFDRTNVSCP